MQLAIVLREFSDFNELVLLQGGDPLAGFGYRPIDLDIDAASASAQANMLLERRCPEGTRS